jgi:HPt (histidine-containing phosphotransfer) domain-containing protein
MAAPLSLSARPHASNDLAAAGAAPTPKLDAVALARLAELDPAGQSRLIERVLEAFRASVVRLRPQFEAARADGDLNKMRLVVHTLKSSAASIGALELSTVCARIETSIRLDAVGSLGSDLDAFVTTLEAALRAVDQTLRARS